MKAKLLVRYIALVSRLLRFRVNVLFNRNLQCGPHVRIYGPLSISVDGPCEIGRDVVFIGKTAYNPAGVNRMCSLRVEEKGRLKIGDHVGFSGVSIVATESIEIGEYCMVGANVSIWDTDFHPLEWVLRRQNSCANTRHKGIHIGNDVFLGAGSIILKGVTIGDRAIIGAGSVVRGDIPADEVWAGNPAIFIRKLGDETTR